MQNLELSESPKETDVVIQVRLCDGPVHQYKYYSWKNYFSHVLPRLQPPPKRIKIVTTCNPRRNGVVKDLLENVPNAEVAKPRLQGSPTTEKSVAADFVYLARATRLVVTESTYSWWAAYVGQATEIHAPGVGIVPVPADDPRYVFHDIVSRKYWGRWDPAARAIRYPDVEPARRRRRARTKSSKGDDDDDAIPMGFGVGHPSFKAAFPVSESWGS